MSPQLVSKILSLIVWQSRQDRTRLHERTLSAGPLGSAPTPDKSVRDRGDIRDPREHHAS